MAKNILLAVDALHYAPEATEMAKELCRGPEDKVTILHVHEFAVGRFGRVQVDCSEGEAERLVTSIRTELAEAGIDAEAEIRETHVGHIARTIVEAAHQHDARIIVLGSARSTDLPPIPFGSVSLKVLHLAKRPVIIVPRQSLSAAEQAAIAADQAAISSGHAATVPVTP
jgi:nucleotide-binding universal stress UspA family protein